MVRARVSLQPPSAALDVEGEAYEINEDEINEELVRPRLKGLSGPISRWVMLLSTGLRAVDHRAHRAEAERRR